MLKRILVGLNGSEYSLAAMELAIGLAKQHQAGLLGLGIVDLPRLTASEPVPLGAGAYKHERDAALLQDAHQKIDGVLKTFAQRCAAAGLVCAAEKLEGDATLLLVREAQRADLLVLGKKHVPSAEWERGTHTLDQVLRLTPRPVLCVPIARADGSPVLVAYDGSLPAARTLHAFAVSGLAAGRALHVLSLGNDAQEHAQLAGDYLRGHDVAPTLHVEGYSARPAQRIGEIAQQLGAGLIVMGTYGQPRLKEILFGSVTKAVLAGTQLPLFLYH